MDYGTDQVQGSFLLAILVALGDPLERLAVNSDGAKLTLV